MNKQSKRVAAALAGVAAATAGVHQAEAAITSGVVNQTVSDGTLDVFFSGSFGVQFSSAAGVATVAPLNTVSIFHDNSLQLNATNFAEDVLIAGPNLTSSKNLSTSANVTDQFDGVTDGYLGFTFGGNNGWVRLDVDASTENPTEIFVKSWAFEDSGDSINAGQGDPLAVIPGPVAALAGLALGATGAMRRRRRAAM